MPRLASSVWLLVVIGFARAMAGETPRELLDRSNRFLDRAWPKVERTPSVVTADSFETCRRRTSTGRRNKQPTNSPTSTPPAGLTASRSSSLPTSPRLDIAAAARLGQYHAGRRGDLRPEGARLRRAASRHLQSGQRTGTVRNRRRRLQQIFYAEVRRQFHRHPTADLRANVYRASEIPGTITFSLPAAAGPSRCSSITCVGRAPGWARTSSSSPGASTSARNTRSVPIFCTSLLRQSTRNRAVTAGNRRYPGQERLSRR